MQLAQPGRFFDALRSGLLAPSLSLSEVEGCNAILTACSGWPLAWQAYGLGTAYHETGHTLQPVREVGSDAYLSRMYDTKGLRPQIAAQLGNTEPGDGVKFAGRGLVQLTGRANYARAEERFGAGLIACPDLALTPTLAGDILRSGMELGWFTGKTLADFLPPDCREANGDQFRACRAIINGHDDEALIADAALAFQAALSAGAWPVPFVQAPAVGA